MLACGLQDISAGRAVLVPAVADNGFGNSGAHFGPAGGVCRYKVPDGTPGVYAQLFVPVAYRRFALR